MAEFVEREGILHATTGKRLCSQFCELCHQGPVPQGSLKPNTGTMEPITVPLIKALARHVGEHNSRYQSDDTDRGMDYTLHYPLLVLRGPMFEYYLSSSGEPQVDPTNHVVIVRHYASKTISGVYAIDAVHETFLENYLAMIERESKLFARRVLQYRLMGSADPQPTPEPETRTASA